MAPGMKTPRRRQGDRGSYWPVPRVAGIGALLCIGFWIWVAWLVLKH